MNSQCDKGTMVLTIAMPVTKLILKGVQVRVCREINKIELVHLNQCPKPSLTVVTSL